MGVGALGKRPVIRTKGVCFTRHSAQWDEAFSICYRRVSESPALHLQRVQNWVSLLFHTVKWSLLCFEQIQEYRIGNNKQALYMVTLEIMLVKLDDSYCYSWLGHLATASVIIKKHSFKGKWSAPTQKVSHTQRKCLFSLYKYRVQIKTLALCFNNCLLKPVKVTLGWSESLWYYLIQANPPKQTKSPKILVF